MQKGDWLLIIALVVIVVIVVLFALNIDSLFPVLEPEQAAKSVINTINSTIPK